MRGLGVMAVAVLLAWGTPAWGADAQVLWEHGGSGWTYGVAIVDGKPVVGGRGVGLVQSASLADGRFGWLNKWQGWQGPESDRPPHDDDTAYVLDTADIDGNGSSDVVAGGDHGLFAIDSATGATRWHHTDFDQGSFNGASEAAAGDFDADGDVEIAYADLFDQGITFVDGKTGTRTAFYERGGAVLDLVAGDLDGNGDDELLVVGNETTDGFPIHAVDFAAGEPVALWRQLFTSPAGVLDGTTGDPVTALIADTAPAPGVEAVIGGNDAVVVLSGATGAPQGRGTLPRTTYANDLAAVNLDLDAQQEIVASLELPHHTAPEGHVAAFDGTGANLWMLTLPGPAFDVEVTAEHILVGGGWPLPGGRAELDGFVFALEKSATGAEQAWRRDLPQTVRSLASGDVFGEPTILASQYSTTGEGGGVFGLAPDGAIRWEYRTGGRREDVSADDLDGDGRAEVLEAASDSYVAVHRPDGSLWWQARVPGIGGPVVWSLAAGDISAHAGREVVAGTWQYGDGAKGTLHAYAAGGERLWNAELFAPGTEEQGCANAVVPGPVDEIEIADLDADGRRDVVAAGPGLAAQESCGPIVRFDDQGNAVWRSAVRLGTRTSIDLIELNGDGVRDVIANRRTLSGRDGIVWGIDGRDGSVLWQYGQASATTWTSAGDGAVAAGDIDGLISVIERDGSKRWEVRVGEGPEMYWGSWEGEWSVDADGDGTRDLLVGHYDAATRMISGKDGSVLWSTPTGGPWAFEVATIRGGEQPVVATGLFGERGGDPGAVDLLDARTGEFLSTHRARNFILDIAAGDVDGDGAEEAVAGAGYQLTVLKSGQAAPDPDPAPPVEGAPPAIDKLDALAPAIVAPGRAKPKLVVRRKQRMLRGRLEPPAGLTYSVCRGRIKAGGRSVRLQRDCTFKLRLPRGSKAKWVRFVGNKDLVPVRARLRSKST